MENNRNWAGIAALILAGLALLVALAGRGAPNFDFSAHVWNAPQPGNASVSAVPAPDTGQAAVPAPAAPVPPVKPDIPVAPVKPDIPVPPVKAMPPGFRGPFGNGQFGAGHFGPSGFTPFRLLGGFVQLFVFLGFLFLVFRFFRRRQQAFARRPMPGPPPPNQPGPPGETPTIHL